MRRRARQIARNVQYNKTVLIYVNYKDVRPFDTTSEKTAAMILHEDRTRKLYVHF